VSSPRPPLDECANCGAAIPRHARACPECGADERSGWRDASVYDGLDLPDSAYDDPPQARPRFGLPWYWIVTAIVMIVVAVFLSIGRA
jgi:predicted nucleic acid-binding Zn ribbon protein